MLLEYVEHALAKAKYEILEDSHAIYGEIPCLKGVYATASNLEKCRKELRETLEEWLLIRLRKNLPIQMIGGINLELKKAA